MISACNPISSFATLHTRARKAVASSFHQPYPKYNLNALCGCRRQSLSPAFRKCREYLFSWGKSPSGLTCKKSSNPQRSKVQAKWPLSNAMVVYNFFTLVKEKITSLQTQHESKKQVFFDNLLLLSANQRLALGLLGPTSTRALLSLMLIRIESILSFHLEDESCLYRLVWQ